MHVCKNVCGFTKNKIWGVILGYTVSPTCEAARGRAVINVQGGAPLGGACNRVFLSVATETNIETELSVLGYVIFACSFAPCALLLLLLQF